MSRTIEFEPDVPLPQDRLVDRRSFLARMGAATAVATAAPLVLPGAAVAQDPEAGYAEVIRDEALADPTELTIAEAATLIRRRDLSSVELVQAYLDRIERFDPSYRAFNTVLGDSALARARRLDRRRSRGPLHGIPVAVKDNFYTAGVRTTANSYIFADFVPSFDATVVARLLAAGAIPIGKTQMGPLATTRATTPDGLVTTVNAWTPENPAIDPSGSSTGSATATAGRMATTSVGTQTGGSITGPSNAQGLTGLKPTFGRASLYGIVPLTYTRDHPGPLARDARDAAIVLQAMAGPDPNDPRTRGLPPVPDLVRAAVVREGRRRYRTRVGVIPDYLAAGPDAGARRAMLDELDGLGFDVVDVALPDDWALLTGPQFNNVRLAERTEAFLEYLRRDVRLFGVSLSSWIQGLFVSGDEYLKGQRAKLLLIERVLAGIFDRVDVVVQTSPLPFDIIGLPEIAFPIGFTTAASGETVPQGAVIGGAPYAEERLVELVAAYQSQTDWHQRRPPDPVDASAAQTRRKRPRLTAEDVVRLSE